MGKELEGTEEQVFNQTNIKVTSASGYLCHITCESVLPCAPGTVFAILTNPDNSNVFRDIKSLGHRRVVNEEKGLREVEVEQQGEIRIMWKRTFFSTLLAVTEDARDPAELKTSFQLLKSDVLSRFQGTWTLHPGPAGEAGAETTRAVLEQDVLPKGIPPAMQHLPVLGGILRGISVRAVRRLVEDLHAVIQRTNAGQSLAEALGSDGKGASRLGSHALDDLSGSDDGE